MDLPIACTLTEAELRERRQAVLDAIQALAIDTAPTDEGYSYRFEATSETLARLSNLVEMERQCCQFLTFKIVVEPQQPIRLEVTGPPEAKAIIAELFGK
jgi:hypothetical protein